MMKWYVVYVKARCESKVVSMLEAKVRNSGMDDLFMGFVTNKEWRGYVMVKMEMNEKTRDLVRSTNHVLKFLEVMEGQGRLERRNLSSGFIIG